MLYVMMNWTAAVVPVLMPIGTELRRSAALEVNHLTIHIIPAISVKGLLLALLVGL